MRPSPNTASSFCIKAIHKLAEYLSFQVRNVARELVDAFDLPDHVTRAPIAMQSEAYSQYTQYVGFWSLPKSIKTVKDDFTELSALERTIHEISEDSHQVAE